MQIITTPKGEELVLLPRGEYERLLAAIERAEHARDIEGYRRGDLETLDEAEMTALLASPTPLAFWRRRRGLTQAALARQVGVSQSFIAEIELGKKVGEPALYRRMAEALAVTMEQLVPA
jgi:DNA-binding XRE family transcriptional regulator